jgi:uncharacterized damage-inducible protein DinB
MEFPIGLRTIRNTLVHIAGAEWTYNRRLRGEVVGAPEERPYTSLYTGDLESLERFWVGQAEETRHTLAAVSDWDQSVDYVGIGDDGREYRQYTTAAGIATQLLFHEIHHRAQVMAMLRQLGVAAENLDFSTLMFETSLTSHGRVAA